MHPNARLTVLHSDDQQPSSGKDICMLPCRQHVLAPTVHAMIMLAAEPPFSKNGDVAARIRTHFSLEDDSSCQTDDTLPEQCDGAASIPLGGAPSDDREDRLFANFGNYLAPC